MPLPLLRHRGLRRRRRTQQGEGGGSQRLDQTVCVDTGAYYADLTEVLCTDGYLRDEYADGSGRALNNTGLREVLNFLRDHSTEAQ